MTRQEIIEEANEYAFMLKTSEPVTLMETIDRIKDLRAEAERAADGCSYDPEGHTQKMCEVMRAAADALEEQMHERIGW